MPKSSNKTQCPHCETDCKTVKTKQISRMYREVTYVCQNPKCGHIFVASVTPVRTLAPSAAPCDDVRIPVLA